jgi:hypothetical protein
MRRQTFLGSEIKRMDQVARTSEEGQGSAGAQGQGSSKEGAGAQEDRVGSKLAMRE